MFDKCYEEYDQWYKTKTGAFIDKLETDTAFELLKPHTDQKILDVGCGTGNFSIKLALMGCHVTGIDISKNMLGEARKKAKNLSLPISFEQLDCQDIDYPPDTFDGILSMTAFEFIDNPVEVFQKLMNVLKPRGKLVIGTIQKGGLWQQLYSSDLFKDSVYSNASFKTKEEMIELGKNCVVSAAECLYIPPGLDESEYTPDNEEKYRKKDKAFQGAGIVAGGFVCVCYIKK